jgi:REP element-mobilizing transposase RayT
MARPLRIELPGGLYHITARGDRREAIYLADADRRAWLELLGQVCDRFNWVCHAYCQMTNHYHLVVETPDGNLSRGMRQLNGVYTQYLNRTHARVGHVFQGRYTGIVVEKQSYLLELARYVVLNPVRADMVKSPGAWAWSSYRATIGRRTPQQWLDIDWTLSQFARQRRRAIDKYVDFVRAGVGLPSIWEDLSHQIYLGSERFVERMQKQAEQAEDLSEIPRAQRRPQAKPLSYYQDRYRDSRRAMAEAYRTGDYKLKAIGEYFGVHYATVSRAVKAFEGGSVR